MPLGDELEKRVLRALRAVPGVVRYGESAEKPRGVAGARAPVCDLGLLGHPRDDIRIGCFLQHDDIWCDRTDDRGDLCLSAGPAEANVVAEDAERHAVASAFDSSRVDAFSSSTAATRVKYGWSNSTSRAYCTRPAVA